MTSLNWRRFSPFSIFILACLLANTALAFTEGDYIDCQRRTRVGVVDTPTDWSVLLASQLPRFKIPREVLWRSLETEELKTLNNQDFKFQLAFDKGLYQTPWLTMYSYNPMMVLKKLDIVFTYSDSVIMEFKVFPEYTTLTELEKEGSVVKFEYHWVEFGEHDTTTAQVYLFGFTLVLAIFFAFRIALTSSTPGRVGRDLRA